MMINERAIATTRKRNGERGFGLPDLLIAVGIIAAVSALALINLKSARATLRTQNSVRQLASYMEKARIDAVRRHSSSSVTFTSPTSYTVHMDFQNSGTPTDRSFTFDSGVQLASSELPVVNFNWRGRTVTAGASCVTTFSVKNSTNAEGINVDVSGSGDVTVENKQPTLPNVPYNSGISSSSSVRTNTVVSGTDTMDSTPCLDVSGEGSAGESGPPQCEIHISSTSVSVKKNNGGTTSVLVSLSVASGVVATYPSNLTLTPSTQQTVSTGTNYVIKSNNNLRGPFYVTFSSQCGSSIVLKVNVTN